MAISRGLMKWEFFPPGTRRRTCLRGWKQIIHFDDGGLVGLARTRPSNRFERRVQERSPDRCPGTCGRPSENVVRVDSRREGKELGRTFRKSEPQQTLCIANSSIGGTVSNALRSHPRWKPLTPAHRVRSYEGSFPRLGGAATSGMKLPAAQRTVGAIRLGLPCHLSARRPCGDSVKPIRAKHETTTEGTDHSLPAEVKRAPRKRRRRRCKAMSRPYLAT
jgi:hypothetical protein